MNYVFDRVFSSNFKDRYATRQLMSVVSQSIVQETVQSVQQVLTKETVPTALETTEEGFALVEYASPLTNLVTRRGKAQVGLMHFYMNENRVKVVVEEVGHTL
jgi:hypothetical protein